MKEDCVRESINESDPLQKKSVPFELMLYPGERHGLKGNERNLLRYRLYPDVFKRKLMPETSN